VRRRGARAVRDRSSNAARADVAAIPVRVGAAGELGEIEGGHPPI